MKNLILKTAKSNPIFRRRLIAVLGEDSLSAVKRNQERRQEREDLRNYMEKYFTASKIKESYEGEIIFHDGKVQKTLPKLPRGTSYKEVYGIKGTGFISINLPIKHFGLEVNLSNEVYYYDVDPSFSKVPKFVKSFSHKTAKRPFNLWFASKNTVGWELERPIWGLEEKDVDNWLRDYLKTPSSNRAIYQVSREKPKGKPDLSYL